MIEEKKDDDIIILFRIEHYSLDFYFSIENKIIEVGLVSFYK